MKVEAAAGFDGLDAASWNGLVERSALPTVFLSWQWQTAWARAFAADVGLRVLVARGEDGAPAGVLPLYQEAPGLWQIVGGTDASDYLDLVAEAGREREVWDAVLGLPRDPAERWLLRGLRAGSPSRTLVPALAAAHGLGVRAEVEERCPILALPASWDEYLARLSGKDRHELRRKMRRLETALGGARVRSHASPAGWDAALADFVRLHRASRVGKAKFMDERMEGFFADALAALAGAGWARLWFLDGPAGPVASFICFEYAGAVGLYNSGFDPAHAALSPGIVLLGHVIRDAIERGIPVFDFLRGEERYKYAFGPVATDLWSLRLAP